MGSALPYIAVHYSILQCITVHCSALQYIAVHYSTLQCITVYCSTLQYIAVHSYITASAVHPVFVVECSVVLYQACSGVQYREYTASHPIASIVLQGVTGFSLGVGSLQGENSVTSFVINYPYFFICIYVQ